MTARMSKQTPIREDLSWRDGAACVQVDGDLFFPEDSDRHAAVPDLNDCHCGTTEHKFLVQESGKQ